LEAALEKNNKLSAVVYPSSEKAKTETQNSPTPTKAEYTLEESLGLPTPKSQVDVSDSEAKLAALKRETAEAKAQVEETVTESKQKLNAVKSEADAAKTDAEATVSREGKALNGLNYSVRRITSQIPILRETEQLVKSIQRVEGFGLGSIGGLTGIVFLALSVYQMLRSALDEQKQQQEEYRQLITQQGDLTTAQYNTWANEQQRALDYYRTKTIP
jgi:hypothetical protein